MSEIETHGPVRTIGVPTPLIDGPEKVSGKAKYSADFNSPDTLVGRILRSPHGHANILSIDGSAAEALPGVMAICTGEDCTETYGVLPIAMNEYAIAKGRTRYRGEAVAAVAATDVATAQKALDLEAQLFDQLLGEVTAQTEDIARLARAAAVLDVASGLAQLAVERHYCRPIVDNSLDFDIRGGRHAVVEALAEREYKYVPNDCDLGLESHLWLVTGPNMAGKSTFLRQNALIAVLAQMGSFVPAERAHIGVVDRLFSRVGAADDLARGRSTFMVEMIETAAILNLAGPRALVILDEIGRGTATYDGLSIAWAAVEHLHEVNKCRTLFATHYHELTALAPKLDRLSCNTMRVKEWQDDVVFLHEVISGAADRSYGIHVARLAGLPEAVLSRSEEVLATLEKSEQSGAVARLAEDLPLFAAPRPSSQTRAVGSTAVNELRAALFATDVDSLSPRAALELVYRLRAMLPDE